jgi:hypothetical protein
MEVSGQLHAPARSFLTKTYRLYSEYMCQTEKWVSYSDTV